RMNTSNPFLPGRIEAEKKALGEAYREGHEPWNLSATAIRSDTNLAGIYERAGEWVVRLRAGGVDQLREDDPGRLAPADRERIQHIVYFWLYHTYSARFDGLIEEGIEKGGPLRALFFRAFQEDWVELIERPGLGGEQSKDAPHLFALYFQLRRALYHVFRFLTGRSRPMAELRASIWQSIFTYDLDRYRLGLWEYMADFHTLITGPSGSGKELVARAVGFSRYLPVDPKTGVFAGDFAGSFFPLHLASLSPALIESELFGHRRGAFTGALQDRAGWLQVCPADGAVFLDEIGEVSGEIQVKLLRVLQERTFQRLGESETRRFAGKIIAATNRNLEAEMQVGGFRKDFFYRLCSDRIVTPSLADQLEDRPDDLELMVGYIASSLPGTGRSFVDLCIRGIRRVLGAGYPWPGNFRELEQCVRTFLIRGEYAPAVDPGTVGSDWNDMLGPARMTTAALLHRYTKHAYEVSGRNVAATARRLDVDRRTVLARLAD
ncbi:MAG: sigma-54-dependent Fis family transcriptional regulator, partial [Verrucomicrobia bacterium]